MLKINNDKDYNIFLKNINNYNNLKNYIYIIMII